MSAPRTPIRVELLFGALHGLGLALAVWLPLASPALRRADCLVFVALAAVTGGLSAGLFRRPGPFLAYPAILAAWLVHGLGAAVATCGLAVPLWALLGADRVRRGRTSRLLLETAGLSLATVVAAGLSALVTGGGSIGLPGMAAHASAFAAADLAVSAMARRWRGRRRGGSRRDVVARALVVFVALPAAWLVVEAHAGPDSRGWLVAVPWTLTMVHLGRAFTRHRHDNRPEPLTRRSASIYRSLTLGLARAASSNDPALSGHQRRVEWLSLAVAERLGLPRMEVEALSAAAWLHESGRVALLDGAAENPGVEAHPGLAAELVSMIRYPYPVLPIVRHARERWDGAGRPGALAGDAIPRGARILAVADYYDSVATGRGLAGPLSPTRAVARLREEAGRRFDPLVVDLLVEHLEKAGRPGRSDSGLRALRTGERELELLSQIRHAALAGLELDDRLALIAARIGARLAHRAFVVYGHDEADDRLTVRFAFGEPARRLSTPELPADRGIFGLALAENRALIAGPADLPRAIHVALSGPAAQAGGASCLIAPLARRGQPRGLLVLYDIAERRYAARDLDLAARVARIVGSLIASTRDDDRVRVALTDPSTGLPNARFIRLALDRRLPGPGCHGAGFGLVAVVVVGGESTGEERRLRGEARRLAGSLRAEEMLARFGPEHFVLLTPIHRPGELVERTQEIVRELAGTTEPARTAHAAYPGDGESVEALLSALDERMALCSERGPKLLAFRPARSAS